MIFVYLNGKIYLRVSSLLSGSQLFHTFKVLETITIMVDCCLTGFFLIPFQAKRDPYRFRFPIEMRFVDPNIDHLMYVASVYF